MRLSGCDHIRIHVGKRSRHAFGSLRANSLHRFRFDSLLTTSPRCLCACTCRRTQEQEAAPDAPRPEVVLAPRDPPACATAVGVRGGHVPLALLGRRGRGVEGITMTASYVSGFVHCDLTSLVAVIIYDRAISTSGAGGGLCQTSV